MNRLIGDLVDVASIEAGVLAVTREVGDPTTIVTEAVDAFQLQAATAGVSLAAEIVTPVSLVAFDAARILQVLTNSSEQCDQVHAGSGEDCRSRRTLRRRDSLRGQ